MMFRKKIDKTGVGLTFGDFLMLPEKSYVEPNQTSVSTRFSKKIDMNIPIIAAAMDTVSEKDMGIAMARLGGLAVIHRNMGKEDQAKHVRAVKEAGFIIKSVLSCGPANTLLDAKNIMESANISGIPVVKNDKVIGIITYRDLRFQTNLKEDVRKHMTKDVVTVGDDISMKEALALMKKHKIERLPVLRNGKLVGIITEMDIRREQRFSDAIRDKDGNLLAAAAVGPFDMARAKLLAEADVDAIIIDTAHAHNMNVVSGARKIRKEVDCQLVVGNIATAEAAEDLISAGADAVKVGIGPGSICTTRIIAGVGVPQVTAIASVADAAQAHKVPVIADGGIIYSGDIAKAIAAGADCVMVGNLLAGTDEAPGKLTIVEGRKYKQYRGMGSLGAMSISADRYFQNNTPATKFVPEGIEGLVPYRGPVADMVHQLIGGLRSALGYVGAKTIPELQKKSRFIRISGAGLQESHPHDVMITDEAPNYYKIK